MGDPLTPLPDVGSTRRQSDVGFVYTTSTPRIHLWVVIERLCNGSFVVEFVVMRWMTSTGVAVCVECQTDSLRASIW